LSFRAVPFRRVTAKVLVAYFVYNAVLAIFLAELLFNPKRLPMGHRAAAEATAARFGATLNDVSVRAEDGAGLRAWFFRPARSNGEAVILLHGLGGNRDYMQRYVPLFLSHGYSVLVPDLRAHGLSGGEFPTYGIKEADDVHAWHNWLELHERSNCVYGMGESMGAAVVLQAVSTTPFCAVVAEGSFATFREVMYIRIGQVCHTGQWLGRTVLGPAVELAFLYGWLTRGVNLASASPEERVAGSHVPVLLIHGLDDHNLPPRQSEMIRDRNPGEITLWEVPQAGHCAALRVAPAEFITRVIGWFQQHEARPPNATPR